jgi:hypothetical protein
MRFRQDFKPFDALKPHYIPAIYHKLAEGGESIFQLSIPFDGQELVIDRAATPFICAGFNDVIAGAVLRLHKLFHPENLDLKVLLYKTPSLDDLSLVFELYNTKKIKIANEDYTVSVVGAYSYSNKSEVTYYPILYREACSNGMLAVINQSFTETIPADKIFEIGCEWSKCNFEDYQKLLNELFQHLREEEWGQSQEENDFIENVKSPDLGSPIDNEMYDEVLEELESVFETSESNGNSIREIIDRNLSDIGYNAFAKLNIITDFATSEPDPFKRLEMIKQAGYYVNDLLDRIVRENSTSHKGSIRWSYLEEMSGHK